MPYIAMRRLYRTAGGKIVPQKHPQAAYLVVGEGGTLSDEDAERYGLVGTDAVKAIGNPPANKARMFPPANKRR